MAKATKRVKKKEHEKLSDANIDHVIELIQGEKPITKKAACEILNIAYNTSRLDNIIEGRIHRKEIEAKNRKAKQGTPAQEYEIEEVVSGYLSGYSVSDIAKGLFRPSSFVTNIVEKLGVPKKATGEDKYKPAILPEQCIAESFEIGETVWSAKYHSACTIEAFVKQDERHLGNIYRIYILEPLDEPIDGFPRVEIGGFNAYAPAYELGSLKHLSKYCKSLK